MNAHEGAAVLYPGAERSALLRGERVTACVIPDDKLEFTELLRVHDRAILSLKKRPAPTLRNRGQGRVRGLNGGRVPKSIGLGVDQNAPRFQSGRKSRRSLIKYGLREVFAHEGSPLHWISHQLTDSLLIGRGAGRLRGGLLCGKQP